MNNRTDPLPLDAWRALLTSHARIIARIERDMVAEGVIPLIWYDVLVELQEAADHRLRLSGLAEAVLLSRSGVTRLVDRLETAGLLRREACATDRRGAYAVLTDAGQKALQRAWPVYARGIADGFGRHLTVSEATTLTELLGRMPGTDAKRDHAARTTPETGE